jgi:PAS domain S-box-containing protein
MLSTFTVAFAEELSQNCYRMSPNGCSGFIHVVYFIHSNGVVSRTDQNEREATMEEVPSSSTISPELLQAMLDNPYEGMVIIDANGIIRHFSRVNEAIYGIPAQEALGRHILEVVPNSRLHIVARDGRAEIGETFNARGKQVVVSRYPLKRGQKIIGAVGKAIFHNLKALVALKEKIRELESTVKRYQQGIRDLYPARYTFDDIVGKGSRMHRAKEIGRQLARAESPVLLTGESGTGKELFAHAIHQASARKTHPFVRVNCASIPSELFEAELFGYEVGAFTGAARSGKPGKFELADKGTIFLDEIGELPLGMQAKLLRVLQEKEVERLGARKPRVIDFRVIAASNKDLESRMAEGYFRSDLFYRLNVNSLVLPPLKDIKEDIPLLVKHFLYKLQGHSSTFISEVDPEVIDAFSAYAWPGNIRELENVIERALNLSSGKRITIEELPESLLRCRHPEGDEPAPCSIALHQAAGDAEKAQILKALRQANGNKSEAAHHLNIHRSTLYYKLRKYRLAGY